MCFSHSFYLKKTFIKVYLLFLFSYALIITSCKQNKQQTDAHPEYFDKVFKQAAHLEITDTAKVLSYLHTAFAAFHEPGIKDLYLKYRFIDHYYGTFRKDFVTSQIYNDSALWTIRDHIHEKAFTKEYADALFNEGFLLVQQKKYEEAFTFDLKARQAIEASGDECLLGTYSATLAWVSNLQGKYLAAAGYTKQAVKAIPLCNGDSYGSLLSIGEKLDDIGIYYTRAGMQDSALYFFKASLDTFNNVERKFRNKTPDSGRFIKVYKGVIYGNMGGAYYKAGDTVTAERLFKESIKINNHKGYEPGDSQFTLIKLATLYLDKNRLPEARQVLLVLRTSLNELPNASQELKYYRLQLDYLAKSGNGAQSYKYITPYLKIQDSIAQIKPIPQVDIHADYERLKNQYNLVVLQKNDQLKTIELSAIIAVTLLVAGILLAVWFNLKRSRKNVHQLTALNNQVTDQNRQMGETLNALEKAQEENSRVMQIVAHDLRNPIGSMYTLASILLDSSEQSVKDKELLELIKISGKNCMDLVGDLLTINIKTEELKNETVDLVQMLNYSVAQLAGKAAEKKQQITLNTQNCTIPGSPEKLWRVFSNLIGNAVKFSPEGAPISVALEAGINSCLITVKDNGIGIPDELKDNLFDMNTASGRSGTAGEQSFGMGLAISKQIIEAHGGSLWFKSEPGNGTTFYIELITQ